MDIEIKKVNLSAIKLNPDNPRTISKQAMDYLVKSLQNFPEMMELREIVVDETMTILGGNMRYLALQKIKAKECIAKIVKGLTSEQKQEFTIKDNAAFGEWNFDALANNWSDLPLTEWGINLPEDWFGNTSTDREKQGVSSTWDQVKNTENTKIIIGNIETRITKEIMERLNSILETEYHKKGIPIYNILSDILLMGMDMYESSNN